MIHANRVRCSVDLDNAFIALNRIARNALNREPCQPEIAGRRRDNWYACVAAYLWNTIQNMCRALSSAR